MKIKKQTLEAATRYFMIPALAASFLLSLGGCTSALRAEVSEMTGGTTKQESTDLNVKQKDRGNEAGPAVLMGITVFFKLDHRMSGPTYGGERWVSPPTFTFAQGGKQLTIEAKSQGVDAGGRPIDISPNWIPADPGMVAVTPGEGNEVKITVRRAGQSSLKVAIPGFSRELSIRATYQDNAMQVEIKQ